MPRARAAEGFRSGMLLFFIFYFFIFSPYIAAFFSRCFHTRMASRSVWRFFYRKRPSSTQTPALPFSTTSSSIKPNLTPRHTPNRRKPPRRTSHPNAPGNHRLVIGNPCLGGTPRPAVALRLVATHPPLATQHPGSIPPITLPPISSPCPPAPPPPPPPFIAAGQGARLRPPSQNVPQPVEGIRLDTFVHPPPRLTSPSRLHHRPG